MKILVNDVVMSSFFVDSFAIVALIVILIANWKSAIDEVDASVEDSVVIVEESDVDAAVVASPTVDDSVVDSPRQPLLKRTNAISVRTVQGSAPPIFIVLKIWKSRLTFP